MVPAAGKPDKLRLDHLLVQRGLAPTREQARRLIMAGAVRVDGQVVDKPGRPTPATADVQVQDAPRYVSRGGLKLEAALTRFGLAVEGCVAADFGASTGGFTDCLLQAGASRVYALDVGYGQLAWTLRNDPRVVVMERTNVRHLQALPEAVHLVTMDVSFISLRLVLPAALRVLREDGHVVALVKPQFEAGRGQVGKGGVVRDRTVHAQVLQGLLDEVQTLGLRQQGLIPSPLVGPAGNVEFLVHLRPGTAQPTAELEGLVRRCLAELERLAGDRPQPGSTLYDTHSEDPHAGTA
ncbi:MAG: TlyA family RNA methyltransferase [Chloroflexi bacterium]|nr:TlyA family RNA methyltransferase [Chloroflexota bacterium]